MLAGIMAIFEMSVAFNNQQIISRPRNDFYLGSAAQAVDRDLMAFLSTPDLLLTFGEQVGSQTVPFRNFYDANNLDFYVYEPRDDDLCSQLRCRVSPDAADQAKCTGANAYDNAFAASQLSLYLPGVQTKLRRRLDDASPLLGSCVLSFKDPASVDASTHRILIAPSDTLPYYRLYSCYLSDDAVCDFEQG